MPSATRMVSVPCRLWSAPRRTPLVLTLWVWVACCHAPCWSTNGSDVTIPPPPLPVPSSATPRQRLDSLMSSSPPPRAAAVLATRGPSTMTSPPPRVPVLPTVPTPVPYSSLDPSTQSPWSCLAQMECGAVHELGPPPELLLPFLPPPPMPSFLLDVIDSTMPSTAEGAVDVHQECNLCEWANGDNDTVEASTTPSTTAGGAVAGVESGGVSEETTWISILVVASLASAAVGAILMIILIKCRKFKILPVADSCPILPDSYFGSKSNQSATCQDRRSGGSGAGDDDDGSAITAPVTDRLPDKAAQKPQAPHGGGGWSFWRRSSAGTERPLRSSGSLCSEENSYSEEPYVVSEHSSALYAELNSVCPEGNAPYRTYSMNTYSEVTDPGGGVKGGPTTGTLSTATGPRTHRRLISDGTYENAAYVVSENATESLCGCAPTTPQPDTGSLDTPSSSAYYSDSSNQTNGRKRKKKQQRPLDDGRGRCRSDVEAPSPELATPPCGVIPYFPADYGDSHAVHYIHERYSDPNGPQLPEGAPHGQVGTGKRPLPPAPSVPQQQQQQSPLGLRSSMRPLPPVPSQYV